MKRKYERRKRRFRGEGISPAQKHRDDRALELKVQEQFILGVPNTMVPFGNSDYRCDNGFFNRWHCHDGSSLPTNPITFLSSTQSEPLGLDTANKVSEPSKDGNSLAMANCFGWLGKEDVLSLGRAPSIDVGFNHPTLGLIPIEMKAFSSMKISPDFEGYGKALRQNLLDNTSVELSNGLGSLVCMRWMQMGEPLVLLLCNKDYAVFVNLTKMYGLQPSYERGTGKYEWDERINEYLSLIGANDFGKDSGARKCFRWSGNKHESRTTRDSLSQVYYTGGKWLPEDLREYVQGSWVRPRLVVDFGQHLVAGYRVKGKKTSTRGLSGLSKFSSLGMKHSDIPKYLHSKAFTRLLS